MEKQTILVVTSTFPANNKQNGPAFILDLCRHLANQYQVVILTQHRPNSASREDIAGMTVIRYRYAPEFLEILSESGGIVNTIKSKPWALPLIPLLIISQIVSLVKTIVSIRPAIVHAHWLIPQALSTMIALKFSTYQPPVVVTSHGGDLYGLKNKLFQKIKKWIISSVQQMCVVSTPMKIFIHQSLNLTDTDIQICPMGVDITDTFKPEPTISKDSKQLLFVGRLVPKKGVTHLIDSMQILVKRDSNLKLCIVGDGPEKPALISQVHSLSLENNIQFTGSKTHREIVNLYAMSNVAIFPFVQAANGDMEGLGLVVLEAMACNCPVVVGDVPPVHDIVEHESTGLICDPSNVQSLADQIFRLLQDSTLQTKFIDNARNTVIEDYSWQACANRYIKLFDSLI